MYQRNANVNPRVFAAYTHLYLNKLAAMIQLIVIKDPAFIMAFP